MAAGGQRNTFILTVALALIIGSVCSLLVQWRALHDALIVGFPVVTLAVIAWLVWRYWPRRHKSEPPEPTVGRTARAGNGSSPPVLAAHRLAARLQLGQRACRTFRIRIPNSGIANASIVSANYSGTVNDRVALLDATLQFSAATAGETVPLFGDDVAVQQFTVKSGSAELVRDGDNIAVQFNSRGDVTLQIKMLVKIAGDVTKRRLAFAIPPALSSQVALALDESEADVDFPAAISFKRILDKDKTRVEAVMGSGDRVELLWTPRVKRAAEVAATVFCQNAALVTFGGGVMNVRATLDYQITQGELRQARVQLPAGQRLLRVEGNDIRTWETRNENGAQVLVVDLLKGFRRLAADGGNGKDPGRVAGERGRGTAARLGRETGDRTGGLARRGGTGLVGRICVRSGARGRGGIRARGSPTRPAQLFSVFRFSSPGICLACAGRSHPAGDRSRGAE